MATRQVSRDTKNDMEKMDRIDAHVSNVRNFLSDCSIEQKNFQGFIVKHLTLGSIAEYDFIIDSYYLFEDTQLAKRNFLHSSCTEEFGEAYLRVYGLLNACYLQQQAVFVCAEVLGIKLPKQQIESCEIFDYRNCFAAHTPNRGHREAQHSYILDRSGLSEGKLRGYSSNSKVGHVSKDADIVELILAWDSMLADQLEKLESRIVGSKS